MADLADTQDPGAKRKRRIAGVLAVIWAGSWTLSALCWLVLIAFITTIDYMPQPSLGESMKEAWDWVGAPFPLIAAFLVFVGWLPILLIWWRSRRPQTPLKRIVLGGLGGLLGGLILLVLCASIADRLTQAELERQAVDATATALGDYLARSQNMELVGQVGSDPVDFFVASDLFVQGEYAYIVGGITGFHVVDVSNRAEPVEVGSYAVPGRLDFLSVYVSGSYAYVAAGPGGAPVVEPEPSGLRVMDVSNPAAPVEVGSYDTPDDVYDVYVSGSYAYVAAGTGLLVIDVSNPAAPVEVGSYDTPDDVYDVYVSGSYAYVAAGTGLLVIDVSNPAAPVEVGSYDTPDDVYDVYVSGSYTYVAAGTGLLVIDVSNPAVPVEVSSYDTPDDAYGVYVSGSHAYVPTGSSGLLVIDVSNPAVPVEVGSYTPGFAVNVYVSGPYAYLAAGNEGLFILRMARD